MDDHHGASIGGPVRLHSQACSVGPSLRHHPGITITGGPVEPTTDGHDGRDGRDVRCAHRGRGHRDAGELRRQPCYSRRYSACTFQVHRHGQISASCLIIDF